MSWYIEYLILNSQSIKTSFDFESDLYNDVLSVEGAINNLYILDGISKKELDVLISLSTNQTFTSVSKLLNITTKTVRSIFKSVSTRVELNLGSYYSNKSFLNRMRKEYKLTDLELKKVKDLMKI